MLTSQGFPCLFAINSFYKNHMYIYDATRYEDDSRIYLDIYTQLKFFAQDTSDIDSEKNFYTLLVVLPDPQKTTPSYIEKFIFSFLMKLKEHDSTQENINRADILKEDFEFSLDNKIWFPVFLCPKHISTIRQSNISIIAFQPKKTFDVLKKCPNDFYEKTRKATHHRIDKIYDFNRPFFLSNKSSGINAIQYLGFDPIHPEEY
ncbi:YqcI/YcgG family protein [Psychrobacter sp. TAE2020]|uniref:YqcI/YcgG family protein n=1 Tax=Psychrobacter sp. TAE2020 TaxID=2846762 RepID=UPI001C1226C7|nr:YqcI/YcgG family protein [Psychrobacter sp. TAE2020]MBU5616157.1 YqcI/YcgG family protein [Psychrobacter sp. TAE2020]